MGPSDWQGLLPCAALASLTQLNDLKWSSERRDAVQANLGRVVRRKTTAHIDLR